MLLIAGFSDVTRCHRSCYTSGWKRGCLSAQLPAHLQQWTFSFLDGLSLTVALSAVKWSFNEEKTERLFQTAFERRCGETAKLMFESKTSANKWRRAFKAFASDELRFRKGPVKLFTPVKPTGAFQMSSTRYFRRSFDTNQIDAFLLNGVQTATRFVAGFAQMVMLRGEELLLTAPDRATFKQLSLRDMRGNVVRQVELPTDLTQPAKCAFGRFFGYCAAQSAIHVVSLDDGKFERKIDLADAFKFGCGGPKHADIFPISPSSVMLSCPRDVMVTPKSATPLMQKSGMRFPQPALHSALYLMLLRSVELHVWREEQASAGFRRVALLDSSLDDVGGACVREPTCDLIIFTLKLSNGGDIFVYDLQGNLVRRLSNVVPREKYWRVLWTLAWRTTLAIASEADSHEPFFTICEFG